MILRQPGKHRIDADPISSDSAIYPFGSEQQGAPHLMRKHYLKQGLAQGLIIWEFSKTIESSDNYANGGIIHDHPYS